MAQISRKGPLARLRAAVGLGAAALVAAAFGCNTGVAPGARSAEEVAAAGMSKTFAGKNKCNPKAADRPFILEWDATDRSSLEARAASDVLFVRYEGCD